MFGWFSELAARASCVNRRCLDPSAPDSTVMTFDRDVPVQPRVPGQVHVAHCTAADRLDDFVGAYARSFTQRHSVIEKQSADQEEEEKTEARSQEPDGKNRVLWVEST
jgi:hypothetical protein